MEIILKYFPDLSDYQIEQFSKLEALYRTWNEQINVVSRKDIDQLYERHVLHSLAIAKVIKFRDGASILDVGTGGGFPGIPLAIFFPSTRFHLIDSIGKKIKVVNEVAGALGLKNLKAEQKRAEKVKEQYDFVVSRAVTAMPKFVAWVRNNIKSRHLNELPNGILALKGGDLSGELNDYNRYLRIFDIADLFDEPFFATKKIIHLPL